MALLARASGNNFQFSNNRFYKFSLNWIKLRLDKRFHSILPPSKRTPKNPETFETGSSSSPNEKKKKYLVFDKAMSNRRDQAKRSILVQVQSEQSSYELYDYCSHHGKVQEMQHYTVNSSMHFVLIEFKTLSDADSVSQVFTHTDVQHLPVISPMLWFRATAGGSKKQNFSKDIPLTLTNATVLPTSETVNDLLFNAESISDQMKILCNATKLNDTDTRLRFLTARQIETSLSGIFSNISVLPFGSSVNGFGKQGCDLDLVLKLHRETKENSKGRLVYHTKAGDSNERLQARKMMETISDVMQQFLPGITTIRRILHARVPIIKYHQTLTGLECDLSMTNTIGIHMSELLYLYGELDWRVRPLTFAVRMWAKCVQLTNSSPGHWINNFSLTLLVLFYLQQKQILPSLQHLVKLATKEDVRIADDCVDCTFLRDISKLPKSLVCNKDSLEELLTNFFIYYASFDFSTKAISLNAGTSLPKPENSSVFIYNPFEQGLNVAKNMNIQETERLKIEIRNAAWLLDSATENKSAQWGLLSLFQQKLPHQGAAPGRMLEFSTLFNNKANAQSSSALQNISKETQSSSITGHVTKSNKSAVAYNNVDRQVSRTHKLRFSRKQEWRR